MRTPPSPATTYRISSKSEWVCADSGSRSWSSRVVASAVHPRIDSLSGSLPMKFFSRKAGIETVTGGPDATGGRVGGGAGAGGGGGGGGGSGGGGAALNDTSTCVGWPARI